MNSLSSRLILVCTIATVFLMPLYAHHGNQFLSKAMEMNAAEVQLGEMAMNKSQNPRVKDFADMVVKDHKQAMEKMKELRDARATSRGKTDSTADSRRSGTAVTLTPEHQRVASRLSSLSGNDFDREFINEMIREHSAEIRDFEAQTHAHSTGAATSRNQSDNTAGQQTARQKPSSGDQKYSQADLNKDMDTADFAREMLPTLRHHLEEAASIQKELQKR